MRTEICNVPIPWSSADTKALTDEIWRSKSPRYVRAALEDGTDAIARLDMEKAAASIANLASVGAPKKLLGKVLDLAVMAIGWTVEVCEAYDCLIPRDGYPTYRTTGRAQPPRTMIGAVWSARKVERQTDNGLEDVIELALVEECRRCLHRSDLASYPTSHPEFCGTECALAWLTEKASQIAKFDKLDEVIKEAERKQYDKAKEDVLDELEAEKRDKIDEVLDSNENPLLNLTRLYGDPLMSLDQAARSLEAAFRCGMRL